MRFASLLLTPALLIAAVEGVVVNRTTSKPQPEATVTLINLGGGMNTLGSVRTDAQGRFRIEKDFQPGAPHLLQVLYGGVTYNTTVSPGSISTGLQLPVYDSAPTVPDAKVTQHMILLEPTGTELAVSETVIYTNSGTVTLNPPGGALEMYVPPAVNTPVRVMVQAPGGMPVQRPAEKGQRPNTYAVRYPIKPGETRIDFTYSLPASEPLKFESRVLHGGGPVRIVAPHGVTLEGGGLASLGTEPRTNATVYEVSGKEYALTLSGTGSLRAAAGPAPAAEGEEDPSGGIHAVKPRLYKRLPVVLSLAGAMLAIGFVLLYRTGAPATKA
jgi:hypothetical protein